MALLRFDGLSFAYPYATRRTLAKRQLRNGRGRISGALRSFGLRQDHLIKTGKTGASPGGQPRGAGSLSKYTGRYVGRRNGVHGNRLCPAESGGSDRDGFRMARAGVRTGKSRPSDEGHPKKGCRDGGVFRNGNVVPEEDERTIGRAEADAEPRVRDGDEPEAPHFR